MKLYTVTLKDAKRLNQATTVYPEANPLLLGYKYYDSKTYTDFYVMDSGKFAHTAMTDGFNIFLLDEIESKVEQ